MARGSPLAQGRALSPAFGRRVGGVRRGRPSPPQVSAGQSVWGPAGESGWGKDRRPSRGGARGPPLAAARTEAREGNSKQLAEKQRSRSPIKPLSAAPHPTALTWGAPNSPTVSSGPPSPELI